MILPPEIVMIWIVAPPHGVQQDANFAQIIPETTDAAINVMNFVAACEMRERIKKHEEEGSN